jgi:Transposase, Mutator family
MDTFPKAAFELQGRPLCRHYVLVLVDALAVEVEGDAGVVSLRTLHWALGVLDDGQYDVFDAWSTPLTRTPDWRERFARLKDRGADRIDLVASRRALISQAELSAIYPNAKSLDALDPLTPEPPASSSHRRMAQRRRPRLPRVDACNRGIDGALELQVRVHLLVNRSLSRHGRFADEESATAFALSSLERAEQRVVASGASLKSPVRYRSSPRRRDSSQRVRVVAS